MITYHAVGTNVRLRFQLVTGLGAGLTGQTPVLAIKRRSDGFYWTGVAWQAGFVELALTEEDAVNLAGSYYQDFDQAVAGGSPEEYLVRYRNAAPAALNEEQHTFVVYASSLTPERRIAASLADDGQTFRVAAWVEEGGQRVTNYDQMAGSIYDSDGNLIVALTTDTADDANGVFSFATAVGGLPRNVPLVLALSATRGLVTDAFNYGFIRV